MLPVLLGLAQLAPSLLKFFGAGDKVTNVTQEVVNIATQVSGAKSPEEALQILTTNSEKALEFKTKILEADAALTELYFKDVADARKRDSVFIAAGTRNYRADMMFLLAVAVIGWLVWIVWKGENLDEYVKGIFTLVLGRFLGYLDNVYNFEFGSTRSSKQKDTTISQLSEK